MQKTSLLAMTHPLLKTTPSLNILPGQGHLGAPEPLLKNQHDLPEQAVWQLLAPAITKMC